ncbi:VOC family protein [Clavibacter zhangzhiyongii]|jgi:predicted enzyme related to lactoylglutathione lyase|uniref:VOC family protein n=1 Tax=Clavibacter zhangzhiyongii TaxID=2768071 RepID=UPI0039E11E63
MVDSVATVWLPVQDMTRAVAFYRDTLGLTVRSEDEDWSEIDADGLMIGLNAREETSGSKGGGAVISFTPEGSIEDELERLRGRGAEITGEVSDHEWGRILPFQDSEGNDLQLYTPPVGG